MIPIDKLELQLIMENLNSILNYRAEDIVAIKSLWAFSSLATVFSNIICIWERVKQPAANELQFIHTCLCWKEENCLGRMLWVVLVRESLETNGHELITMRKRILLKLKFD